MNFGFVGMFPTLFFLEGRPHRSGQPAVLGDDVFDGVGRHAGRLSVQRLDGPPWVRLLAGLVSGRSYSDDAISVSPGLRNKSVGAQAQNGFGRKFRWSQIAPQVPFSCSSGAQLSCSGFGELVQLKNEHNLNGVAYYIQRQNGT